jgi:hypothetical protein
MDTRAPSSIIQLNVVYAPIEAHHELRLAPDQGIQGHSLIGGVLLLFSIGLKVSGLIYFAVSFVKALRKVITART